LSHLTRTSGGQAFPAWRHGWLVALALHTPAPCAATPAGVHAAWAYLGGLALGVQAASAASARPPLAHLGANLPAVNDYARTPVYVDLMHQSRRFGSPAAPWDEQAVLGADGWPVGDCGVFLMVGQAGLSGTAGTYKVSFTGQASVSAVASSATLRNPAYDAARNRSTVDVVLAADADQLALAFTGTRGGIKHLQVIRPGYDALRPPLFTTPFLNHVARFQTLRFMDWLRTNGNPVATWASRANPALTHHASAAGVPWEHLIALANQGGKDIWINLPVRADDDYVLQLARLLKATLHSGAKIYVEYSNELWNSGFAQYATNVELAQAEVQARPDSPLAYDGTTDRNVLGLRRTAKRLKEISDIFRSVYGAAAMMGTVRPVLAGQVVQPQVLRVGLKFIESVYGPPSRYFYALAGAPYFNLGDQQTAEGLSPAQVLEAMDGSVTRLPVANALEAHVALARWYGLAWLAYEGGADTFGPGSLAAKKAASLAPRLRDICTRYLDRWYTSGGGLFMWYTAGAGNWDTRYGTWSLTTDLATTGTPKLQCVDAMLAAPAPAAQGRNTVPGSFSALAFVGNLPPYSASSQRTLRYLHPGSSLDYLVYAPAAGSYTLVLQAEAGQAGNTLDLALNGQPLASGFELLRTGWGTPASQPPLALPLTQGFNTLRITTRTETSGYALSAFTVR
jgi:hypothetical protein